MKKLLILFTPLTILALSGPVLAQLSDEDAMEAVADRQAVFKLIAHSNRPLGEMLRGSREFDLDALVTGSQRVAMLAGLIPEMFASDTSAHDSPETRAADYIWDNKDGFLEIAASLETGANTAIEILQARGESGLREAAQQITRNCSACHDTYRLP